MRLARVDAPALARPLPPCCAGGAGILGDAGSLFGFDLSHFSLCPAQSLSPQHRGAHRDGRSEGFREETAGRRAG